ncbi:MAG: gamma-glutamyl-gamma-aminobutyrate hydrolase family protein [Chlamydiota bacterium]
MKILYLLHAAFETPGIIESWSTEKGHEQSYISTYLGEVLPSFSLFDLIVVMGGPQSVVNLDENLYLEREIAFIRSALQAKIPVFGFCLGAQLIGAALGVQAEHSPYKEVGIFPIVLTEEGINDPILEGLPQEFLTFHWHGDMPGLTKEAVVLATSAGCPRQIIRYLPHAYAFQCHPEMTLQGAEEIVKNCPEDFSPGEYIQTQQQILVPNFYALNRQNMTRILENFFAKAWSCARMS